MVGGPRAQHLVSAAELRDSLASVRLLDVRWRLSDAPGDGRSRYAAAHLPGARFLDLERALTQHTGDPMDGRHPLPDLTMLERELGALGVTAQDDLVVYDEPGSFAADRAWWVLRWAGLRARILDGGVTAWAELPGAFESGEPPAPAPVRLHLTGGHLATVDADGAAELGSSGLLVDARAPERYRGEVEPLDPRAGHIPGAVNLPATTFYTGDGRLPDDEALRAAIGPLGALGRAGATVGAYCGSGVSAARDVLAFAVVGVDAALFPGSWSAWSNDRGRPAATEGRSGASSTGPVDNAVDKPDPGDLDAADWNAPRTVNWPRS